MISILIALLKREYDTSPSLAAILLLHHWLRVKRLFYFEIALPF